VVGVDGRGDLSALGLPWDTPLALVAEEEEEEEEATHEPEYAPEVVLAAWVEDGLGEGCGWVDDERLRMGGSFHLPGADPLLFYDLPCGVALPDVSDPHDGPLKSFDGTALVEVLKVCDDACRSSELGSHLKQVFS
jgi:hypothetical protein